jgi:hypothetical protein
MANNCIGSYPASAHPRKDDKTQLSAAIGFSATVISMWLAKDYNSFVLKSP